MYILYQSSDEYAPILGISMTSLFENNRDIVDMKVFIAECQMKDENKEKITKLAERYGREIEFLDVTKVDAYLESMGMQKWYGSYSTYYKLFLSQYIPKYVERILYIDCDTIIMPGLSGVNEVDMAEHAVAMRRCVNHRKELIKLGAGSYYYNCGIILFDMRNWEEFNCEHLIQQKAITSQHLLYAEQDLFAIAIHPYIQKLPYRFNLATIDAYYGAKHSWKNSSDENKQIYSWEEFRDACEKPVIVHCMDSFFGRPWYKGNFSPYKKEWKLYRSLSFWPDYETNRQLPPKDKLFSTISKFSPKFFVGFMQKCLAVWSNIKHGKK